MRGELDRECVSTFGACGRLFEGDGRSRGRLLLGGARLGLDRPGSREGAARRRHLGGRAGARDSLDDTVADGARLAGGQLASELVCHLRVLGRVQCRIRLAARGLGRVERAGRCGQRRGLRPRRSLEVRRGGTSRLRLLLDAPHRGDRLLDGPRLVIEFLDQCREGLEGGAAADPFRDRFELGLGDLPCLLGRRHLFPGAVHGIGSRRSVPCYLLEPLGRRKRRRRRLELGGARRRLDRVATRGVARPGEGVEPPTRGVEIGVARRGHGGLRARLVQACPRLLEPGALPRERV